VSLISNSEISDGITASGFTNVVSHVEAWHGSLSDYRLGLCNVHVQNAAGRRAITQSPGHRHLLIYAIIMIICVDSDGRGERRSCYNEQKTTRQETAQRVVADETVVMRHYRLACSQNIALHSTVLMLHSTSSDHAVVMLTLLMRAIKSHGLYTADTDYCNRRKFAKHNRSASS